MAKPIVKQEGFTEQTIHKDLGTVGTTEKLEVEDKDKKSLGTKVKEFFTGKDETERKAEKRLENLEKE